MLLVNLFLLMFSSHSTSCECTLIDHSVDSFFSNDLSRFTLLVEGVSDIVLKAVKTAVIPMFIWAMTMFFVLIILFLLRVTI